MRNDNAETIRAYHYTNLAAYMSMRDGRTYGETGLLPIRRFVSFGNGNDLPSRAHAGVIEGLLEPEPESWTKNEEFPFLWRYLMHDICRSNDVMLLSFEIFPSDDAYVVERAHVERALYSESKGMGKPTISSMDYAFRKYFESRVPVNDYDGRYSVPQLSIWSAIDYDRLKLEWVKKSDDVWARVLKNNW